MQRRPGFLREPELRFELLLARDLGKTRAELRAGRPLPLSCAEFTDWLALYSLENDERERASRKQR